MESQLSPIIKTLEHRLRLRFCWRWLVIPFVALCLWGWFDVRQRGYLYPETPWEHKTDLTVYTEAGAAFFDGRKPYEVSNSRGWTYLYPPLFAMVMAPLHVLPTQDQVLVWFALSLLICWGCIYESGRTLAYLRAKDDYVSQHYTAWYPWLGIGAVCAATLPVLNCLQRGQVGVLKLYLLCLGLRLVLSGRTRWTRILGGVVLALPIVLKVVPLLPVSFLIFVQFVAWIKNRWNGSSHASETGRRAAESSLGLALGMVLFFLIVPSMLVGWKANWQHLQTWSGLMLTRADDSGEDQRVGNPHAARNQSLQNAVYRLGNFAWYMVANGPDDKLVENLSRPAMIMDSPLANAVLLAVRIAILAALGIIGLRLGMRGDALSQATAFGLACVAMLVVSPVSRGHYFLLVAPAVLYLPLWLDRQKQKRAAITLAIIPIVLIDLHYIILGFAGRVGLLGLGMTAWLLAALIFIAKSDPQTATISFSEDAPREDFLPVIKQAA